MQQNLETQFREQLPRCGEEDPQYVTELVDVILSAASGAGATDVHLLPAADAMEMRWRIDGVLQSVAMLSARLAPRIVARLKVLSDLLTYQTDMPQEGRIRDAVDIETRVSTFPTLYGEKCVVRLFAGAGRFDRLDQLNLPPEILADIRRLLKQTTGVFIVTGPAGSGKTTTNYACLREIVDKSGSGKSLVSLEDPIEVIVPGVTQSQVNTTAGFDLTVGLRSLMRQDPEVIMVGEIRDRDVAETVFQASLTGHLVVTTFHAGSAAEAVNRLSDMGIEPFLLKSGLLGILSQRLLRRLCKCAQPSAELGDRMGLAVEQALMPVGCSDCQGTGYRGRFVVAEMLTVEEDAIGKAIRERRDAPFLEQTAVASGMVTSLSRACDAVNQGITSPAEVRRVFGF